MKSILGLAALCLQGQALHAQVDPTLQREFHDHVVGLLQSAASELPSGDTLITFANQGPILYHIIDAQSALITSCMLRNDPMIGVTTTRWSDARITAFDVSWSRSGESEYSLHGEVSPAGISITGSHDTVLAIPEIPWTVADYAMEEHLVPLLSRAPLGSGPASVAILRPYPFKWDTVQVAVKDTSGVRFASVTDGSGKRSGMVIIAGPRLLFTGGSDRSSIKRPLELTPLFSEYERVTALMLYEQ